jgi:asparagine synthase (glutamine-hydrolysing)
MCGFVAIAGQDSKALQSQLHAATDLLQHRGPDDEAYYLSDSYAAGFRRLKIVDLSIRGRQPMRDESGRHWLVFNGEIYNHRELRRDLEACGRSFTTDSDSEVLLKSYIQWGPSCLERFNGMYAFLIWDAQSRELFGARDRFGEKPLFYVHDRGRYYFASEIKALFPLLGRVPEWHRGTVRQYLQHGHCDAGDETFFKGIRSVPPANRVHVKDGRISIAPYWQLQESEQSGARAAERLGELLLDSIKLRTRSDVPVGTCLSGGLDSGSIVCGLSHVFGAVDESVTRKTFTAGYSEYDETPQVNAVIERSGFTPFTIRPSLESLDELDRILAFHDEPFSPPNVFASNEVVRLAKREGVVVLLNGQGADELLGGYSKFLLPYVAQLLRRGHLLRAWSAARGSQPLRKKGPAALLTESLRYWLRAGAASASMGQARSSTREREQAAAKLCLSGDFLEEAEAELPERFSSGMSDMFKRRLHVALFGFHLPHYLRIEDRNSMEHSIESRLPFLDHRIAEFAFSLPSDLFMKDGTNKVLLRECMAGILPDAVRLRTDKFGFPVPFQSWIMDRLYGQVRERILTPRLTSRGVFDTARLVERYEADHKAPSHLTSRYWYRVILLELWFQQLDGTARHRVDSGPIESAKLCGVQ